MHKFFFALSLLGLVACQSEKPLTPTAQSDAASVFVTNEGIFGQTSGTVTRFNRQTQTTDQDIFQRQNKRQLGNVVQSMCLHQDKAYIVVNNAEKIEVVNAVDFKELAQITGLRQPRYMEVYDTKYGFVSEWGLDGRTGSIAVLDIQEDTLLHRIPVDKGPEKMLLWNNKLYVTHTGGYDTENKLSVINPLTWQVDAVLTLAAQPNSLQLDAQNRLWVLCGGRIKYTTYPAIDTANSEAGALFCLNPQTGQIITQHNFPKGTSAGSLYIDNAGQTLFFQHQGTIVKTATAQIQLTTVLSRSFYGLGIDPQNDLLYGATQAGINPAWVLRFDKDGSVQDSFQAGIFANNFYFAE